MPSIDPELLARLLEKGPELVVVMDARGNVEAVNPAWTTLLGWTLDETLGESLEKFVCPEDWPEVWAQVRAGFEEGRTTLGHENRLRTRDGGYRWIRWAAPANSAPLGIGIGIDVTAEIEARREAERLASHLRSVMEAVPGYVLSLDRKGQIVFLNRTQEGVAMDQVVGTNAFNWMPPQVRHELEAAIARVFAGESLAEQVFEGNAPETGRSWYRVNLSPLREKEEVVAVTIYCDDITQQVRSEQLREQASRFEAVGRTAAVIGHDFNNLLMAMNSAAEVIAQYEHGREFDAEVKTLLASLERAGQLTRNLLRPFRAGGKAEHGVALNEVLGELEPVLRSVAGSEISLSIRPTNEDVVVRIAAHELAQILVNLTANSKQAMMGPGTIDISLGAQTLGNGEVGALSQGRYATIEVRDDGPGIAPELRARVFEPFFTTKDAGNGLGLAICYGLAKAHGGDIEISCPDTGGTVVRIWFPLDADSGRSGSSVQSRHLSSSEVSTPRIGLGNRRLVILLAEDEHGTRAALARYLSRLGHIVLEGRDGEDALDVAGRHPSPVDVVITDLVMPRLDGRGLIEELRREHPGLPVIAMTGYAAPQYLVELAQMDVRVFQKPVSARTLVDAALELTGSPSSMAAPHA